MLFFSVTVKHIKKQKFCALDIAELRGTEMQSVSYVT